MPMRSWVSALAWAALALAGCAAARPVPQVRTFAGTGILKIETAGRKTAVKVALVSPEVDPENDHIVTPLGARGSLLLLTDSYASRPQPMSRCQAGHETWVRLIDVRIRSERWSKRVESCLHDIQPGEPIAAWTGPGTAFKVNLLSEPSLHISIDRDGGVVTRKWPS